jgi:hypothetical protein
VRHAEELPRRQGLEVPQVEQERPALEREIDVDRRVTERLVDELRLKSLGHRFVGRSCHGPGQECITGAGPDRCVNRGEAIALHAAPAAEHEGDGVITA